MKYIEGSKKKIALLSVVLIVVFGLLSGVSLSAFENADLTTTEMAFTGEVVSDTADVENALMYESLSETERSNFRENQSLVYNTENIGTVSFSDNIDVYSGYSHIFLDGMYYEITTVETPTFLGMFLFIMSIVFTVATLLLSVLLCVILLDMLLQRVSLETVERLSILFVIVVTVIGVIVPFGAFMYSEPLIVVEVSETPQDVKQFDQLSEEEQSTFVSLVSGDSRSSLHTSLEDGMFIQSDGEIYKVMYDSIGVKNFAASGFIGLISLYFGLVLADRTLKRKKDLLYTSSSEMN